MLIPKRQWVVMTVCTDPAYTGATPREVSRHFTKRGAETAYAMWDSLVAAAIWRPMIVHVSEMPNFHQWVRDLVGRQA